jgi:hypothetical protein
LRLLTSRTSYRKKTDYKGQAPGAHHRVLRPESHDDDLRCNSPQGKRGGLTSHQSKIPAVWDFAESVVLPIAVGIETC